MKNFLLTDHCDITFSPLMIVQALMPTFVAIFIGVQGGRFLLPRMIDRYLLILRRLKAYGILVFIKVLNISGVRNRELRDDVFDSIKQGPE